MSMKTSMIYGYGFCIDSIEDEKVIEFIKNHKDTFCKDDYEVEIFEEIMNYNEDDYDYGLEEILEDDGYGCDMTGMEGIGAPIANIISRETGIRVQYEKGCADCGSEPAVIFAETYPWNFNEKEKELTVESLTEILLPYVKELGLTRSDIDGLEIEYYG